MVLSSYLSRRFHYHRPQVDAIGRAHITKACDRLLAKQAFMRKMKIKKIDIGELNQHSIDNALVEAAGWGARGSVYWEQGQRGKAIGAFQSRVNCLNWAQGMRSLPPRVPSAGTTPVPWAVSLCGSRILIIHGARIVPRRCSSSPSSTTWPCQSPKKASSTASSAVDVRLLRLITGRPESIGCGSFRD